MENKKTKFIDYYDNCVEKEDVLPDESQYDFLLRRNYGYMDHIALSFYNRRITYRELHRKIDKYARTLFSLGVHQGDKVGVCLLNTPEGVFTLYGLNKLGAITVGLSPLNNAYKMKIDLDISKPKIVIVSEPLFSLIDEAIGTKKTTAIYVLPIITEDGEYNVAAKLKKIDLVALVEKERFHEVEYGVYKSNAITDILFTGGSTGIHKGVDLIGNGLNCVVKALDHVLILEPGMIHLGNIPMAHMAFGRLVLHYALCKNLEYALTLDMLPNKFFDEIIRTHANGAMGGPVHWEALIDEKRLITSDLSFLIQAISGGEQFKAENRIAANEALKLAGCRVGIGDGLGLTETWAPTHVCMDGRNTPGTIGYPIPFVSAIVVDAQTFKILPNGKEGLLLISGPGVMAQYHENEEETRKAFFFDANGTKWYNTGDVAIRKDNGEFVYIGRKKRNFVCGVDNIYPEQIESLLLKMDEIVEAAVTKVPDQKRQYLPKYHLFVKDNSCNKEALEKRIHELIASTLGESACPGYIEYTAGPLPRTDNGKINFSLLEKA